MVHHSQPITATGGQQDGRLRRLLRLVIREFKHMLPPVLFFAVGFNLVVFTMNLALEDQGQGIGGFLLATTAALVVGKAVLVADVMPFLRRFDTAPLIQPILFKTAVYWLFVLIARLIEAAVHYLIESGGLSGFLPFTLDEFSWRHFLFVQTWILALFLVYVTGSELNALFGDGELGRILFRHRSSDLKLNRRQRIRTLVRLNHLTAAHGAEELADPHSRAHRQFIQLIRDLAAKASDRPGPDPRRGG
ncbi:hypothetical protein [Geminicoccus roseus]|uniref:hypothetical protein n=1 Tax=Geminicoccus roseus TaxID=404900 RepID=UPI0003FA3F23|nr:hypothetical protein [Geminicoccus roseus]